MHAASEALLRVRGLTVSLRRAGGDVAIVDGVDLELARGEIVALVGESGSGKTTLALAIPRLLSEALCLTAGEIRFEGRDLARASDDELRRVRGARIACVFQDPSSALNPVLSIGEQVGEAARVHRGLSRAAARALAAEWLARVEMPDPLRALDLFPHQLSGGMRQRAQLAMALACEPVLLIADEPTSALDATLVGALLDLLRRLARSANLGLLLVTHDFGVVASCADRVAVMYAGRIVESADVRELLRTPRHPYTRALLAAMPARAQRGQVLAVIEGSAPEPGERPAGCAFHPRCSIARNVCASERPALLEVGAAHAVACPFHEQGERA